MCVESLLNRRYLLVSGPVGWVRVRVRARAMVSARVTVRIGIGFRRNHSWSFIFTPRRNHSLCQERMTLHLSTFIKGVARVLRAPVQRQVMGP